jgi:hypothetical protein
MFEIYDELHAEPQQQYPTRQEALLELERRAKLPWDSEPNLAPCTSWRTCGRNYELREYDTSQLPWKKLWHRAVLELDATGARWLVDAAERNSWK